MLTHRGEKVDARGYPLHGLFRLCSIVVAAGGPRSCAVDSRVNLFRLA